MTDRVGQSPRSAAAALGRTALAELLCQVEEAVCLLDEDRRYLYANPAACRLTGRTADELAGTPFLTSFPRAERAAIEARLAHPTTGTGRPFAATLQDGQGAEHDIAYSAWPIVLRGATGTVVVFRDVTGPGAASRRAVALAQIAAQLVGSDTLNEILAEIARHAFEGSRALAVGIIMMGENGRLDSGGAYDGGGANFGRGSASWVALNQGRGDDILRSLGAGQIIAGECPGPPVVLLDARARWWADPVVQPFARTLDWAPWECAVCVPVAWAGRVVGVLEARFATLESPTPEEIAFYEALADQAASAFTNARLSSRAGEGAAMVERARLAHRLHESVSQALFAMTMHARAAQLATIADESREAGKPLARSLDQLVELTRMALAEMRALVFELRPEALADQGLLEALRRQSDLLAARGELSVTVDGPDERLPLDPVSEEHLYRIATEALHNVVKHAHTDRAAVTIARVSAEAPGTRMTISDRGVGFDPTSHRPGHLGMSSLAQRARAIGAILEIRSEPLGGTAVTVWLPDDGPAYESGSGVR